MRFAGFVVLPFVVQLTWALAIMAASTGNGSFVGLGVLATGVWALPITAFVNWMISRQSPPGGRRVQVRRTVIVSAIYPLLISALFILIPV